jgi:hypothetical protein
MSNNLRDVVQKTKGKGELNLEKDLDNKNDVLPSKYGCQILFQDTTLEKVKDPSLPSDAYLVYYKLEEKICLDLCRGGKRVDIFDFYYDKYGKDSLQKIAWGYGRSNPRIWGYKSPEKKKRK